MKVFAISDLHISSDNSKPMDVFGGNWVNYLSKIREDWQNKVSDQDLVLIGGDVSWAMSLDEAKRDLESIMDLKGTKILIKGNHDYWWNTISKVRDALPQSFYALQNDCVKFGNIIICGSRCWSVPGSPDYKESDEKIYKRETERLKLSFKEVEKIRTDADKVIALIHYPPFNVRREDTFFTKIFEENHVDVVIYGHLHGRNVRSDKLVVKNGIKYYLTSCDQVDNKLMEIEL